MDCGWLGGMLSCAAESGKGWPEDKLSVWGKPWEITEVLSLERTNKISGDGAFGWP